MRIIPVFVILFSIPDVIASNYLNEWIGAQIAGKHVEEVDLFKDLNSIRRTERNRMPVLSIAINSSALTAIRESPPSALRIEIPLYEAAHKNALLKKVELFSPGFEVGKLFGSTKEIVASEKSIHYQGIIEGDSNSMVAFSINSEGIHAMLSFDNHNYEIVTDDSQQRNCFLYDAKEIKTKAAFDCEARQVPENAVRNGSDGSASLSCKTVTVYFECDYSLFCSKKNNMGAVQAYVTSFFNQVAAIYRKEEIDLQLAGINVWTTLDPYSSYSNAATLLTAFHNSTGANFTGNIAHLLTTRAIGGGMSYLDVLCIKPFAQGVSYVTVNENGTPTYSWTTEVVAHEIGHNFGSNHTQWCGWTLNNGTNGPLDNCYITEGGCDPGPTPVNGGTIMSYCHLTNYGICFANGFGQQPGDKIRSRLAAATCIPVSGDVPSGLISSNIGASSAQLNWNQVGNSTYFIQYRKSGEPWTTTSPLTTPVIRLDGLSPSSEYEWQVRTSCSGYSTSGFFRTVSGLTCSSPTGITCTVNKNNDVKISWNLLPGITNYCVRYKQINASDWIITENSMGNNITLLGLPAASTFQIQVRAACSNYSQSVSVTTAATGCPAPAGLSTSGITQNSATFTWSVSNGASNYIIRYRMKSAMDWIQIGPRNSASVNLSGLLPGTAYEWKVKSNCSNFSSTLQFNTIGSAPINGFISGAEKMNIFPNPCGNSVEITLRQPDDDSYYSTLSMMDVLGKVLLNKELSSEAMNINLDLSDFPDGIYILQLTDTKGTITKKRLLKR